MNQTIKPKKCRGNNCDNTFTPGSSLDKYCSFKCAKPHLKPMNRSGIQPSEPAKRKRIPRATPVKRVSTKMKTQLAKYHRLKIKFMERPENKLCPVNGQATTDVHHMMGRVGFADDFARENDIPLLLDERFWLAVSRSGHRWIEENPTQAKERGFSHDRL